MTGTADEHPARDQNHRRMDDNWQDHLADEKQKQRCDTQQLPPNHLPANNIQADDSNHGRSSSGMSGGKRSDALGVERQSQEFKGNERPAAH